MLIRMMLLHFYSGRANKREAKVCTTYLHTNVNFVNGTLKSRDSVPILAILCSLRAKRILEIARTPLTFFAIRASVIDIPNRYAFSAFTVPSNIFFLYLCLELTSLFPVEKTLALDCLDPIIPKHLKCQGFLCIYWSTCIGPPTEYRP